MAEQPPPLPHPPLPPLPLPPPPLPRPRLQQVEQLPKSMTGPICCPYQRTLEDIPIITLDIKNDGRCHERYKDFQDRRLSRVDKIAMLKYSGKPVTARRNRSNPPPWNEVDREQDDNKKGGVSYHFIRLINTLAPEDLGKMVDLLIDDQSHYCLGFRRGFLEGRVEIWIGWFRVSGSFAWPSFLTAEVLPINGDHSLEVEIGGSDTLNDILRSLWKYPEHRHDTVSLRRAFIRAVVVFCETLRLFSVWLLVHFRVRMDSPASPLEGLYWKRIRNWKSTCEFVLDTAGKGHGWIDEDKFWRRYYGMLGYESFEAMVIELRVLIWQDFLRGHYRSEENRWLRRNEPGTEVRNPAFVASRISEAQEES